MVIEVTESGSGETTRGIKRTSVLAWLRMMRSYTKIDRATAEHVKHYDLSVAQFDVLAQVGSHEGCSQNELASALLVTKGNISQLVTKMEARGLVERRSAPVGRDNQLFLTKEGRVLFKNVVPSQEDLIDCTFQSLSKAEQKQLHGLLVKLDRSLDRSIKE